MRKQPILSRRSVALGLALSPALSLPVRATEFREITWDDLVPPGVPFAEIIAEGEMDERNDIWKPVFDENGIKFNTELEGASIRMPGYILPLESSADGVTEFLLVPYVGACIHVPPPPPNQLVLVTTSTPWRAESLWDAVWVSGTMETHLQSTDVAEVGYVLSAEEIELYEWL